MRPTPVRLLVLLAALGAAPASGQAPERAVQLVSVDFVAIGADGRPVPDLTANDVTVRIGGRQRSVRSLQRIAATDPGAAPSSEALPSPFGTNAESGTGRTYVLIVEDESLKSGREVLLRDALDEMLKRLSRSDRLSLVTMPYGGVKVAPTTEHERVRTALWRVGGRAPTGENGSELACRTRRTLETLRGYLDTQGVRDTPTTAIFVTGGLAGPRRDAAPAVAPGMCELQAELFRQIGDAAGAARVQLYIVQPGDIVGNAGSIQRENIAGFGSDGSDNPIEGLEHLAGVTGGTILNLTGASDGGALGRVVRETSAYYLAAVAPERADASGRSQELEIRVTRPGVQVRARQHVKFARPEQGRGRSVNPSLREMIGSVQTFRDLPLRATAYSALAPDGKGVRVVTIAEAADRAKLASLVAALFDQDGKLVSHWTATDAELQRSPVVGAMPADPGLYRLRVAAMDGEGRSGTADYEVEAGIVRTGPLRVSSLVLGLSREGRFVPRLQFGTEPVAIAYVELYGVAAGTPISAAVEIARTMNGPALTAVPLAIEGGGADRYVARGAIPIGALPPGDYAIRALVGIEGQPLTRVVQTLRKQ